MWLTIGPRILHSTVIILVKAHTDELDFSVSLTTYLCRQVISTTFSNGQMFGDSAEIHGRFLSTSCLLQYYLGTHLSVLEWYGLDQCNEMLVVRATGLTGRGN